MELTWVKASASASQDSCVEIACGGETIHVRDSKDKAGPVLSFTPDEWRKFTDRIKSDS